MEGLVDYKNSIQILLSVNNNKDTLAKCLNSIIEQDIEDLNLDIIIFDNMSTDGSSELIEEFIPAIADKFKEVFTIIRINEEVGKLDEEDCIQLLEGYYADHAQAYLVIRLDGDCKLSHKGYLKEQLAMKQFSAKIV